jgi:hypothetical protein
VRARVVVDLEVKVLQTPPPKDSQRPVYAETRFAGNRWFLPYRYTTNYIEYYADPVRNNINVIIAHINTPGTYCWVMYREDIDKHDDEKEKLDVTDAA